MPILVSVFFIFISSFSYAEVLCQLVVGPAANDSLFRTPDSIKTVKRLQSEYFEILYPSITQKRKVSEGVFALRRLSLFIIDETAVKNENESFLLVANDLLETFTHQIYPENHPLIVRMAIDGLVNFSKINAFNKNKYIQTKAYFLLLDKLNLMKEENESLPLL